MPNIYSHQAWWRQDGTQPPPPPTDMNLDQRVTKLEASVQDVRERLIKIDGNLEHLEKNMAEMATKDFVRATVVDAKNSIIMWVVSAFLLAQLLPALLKRFGL